MPNTKYAVEIAHGSIFWKNGTEEGRIERILVKEYDEEEIRFSWWKDKHFVPRPLDLSEDDLLKLMKDALDKGVFTDEFKQRLKAML